MNKINNLINKYEIEILFGCVGIFFLGMMIVIFRPIGA